MTSFTCRLEKESLMQHQNPRPPGFLKVQGTTTLRSLGLILGYWITYSETVPGSAEAILHKFSSRADRCRQGTHSPSRNVFATEHPVDEKVRQVPGQ